MGKYKKSSDRRGTGKKGNSGSGPDLKKNLKSGSKSGKVKKMNPFEIRFVKEKHTVLNRPLKSDVGKPGIWYVSNPVSLGLLHKFGRF